MASIINSTWPTYFDHAVGIPFNAIIAEWMGVVDDEDDDGASTTSKKLDTSCPTARAFPYHMGKDDFFV
jgi:hypothetical protein